MKYAEISSRESHKIVAIDCGRFFVSNAKVLKRNRNRNHKSFFNVHT